MNDDRCLKTPNESSPSHRIVSFSDISTGAERPASVPRIGHTPRTARSCERGRQGNPTPRVPYYQVGAQGRGGTRVEARRRPRHDSRYVDVQWRSNSFISRETSDRSRSHADASWSCLDVNRGVWRGSSSSSSSQTRRAEATSPAIRSLPDRIPSTSASPSPPAQLRYDDVEIRSEDVVGIGKLRLPAPLPCVRSKRRCPSRRRANSRRPRPSPRPTSGAGTLN